MTVTFSVKSMFVTSLLLAIGPISKVLRTRMYSIRGIFSNQLAILKEDQHFFANLCKDVLIFRSTCRLELTEREPKGGPKDFHQTSIDPCQTLEVGINRDKSTKRRSIHEENIVFIEERKILLIPKSKTMPTETESC